MTAIRNCIRELKLIDFNLFKDRLEGLSKKVLPKSMMRKKKNEESIIDK